MDYFIHESAIVDDGCSIGAGTKIWHFCHLMSGSTLGKNCNIGQNVMIASDVILGQNVKVQNNVSIYTGVICEDNVFLGPSMVFTNINNPRSAVTRKNKYEKTLVRKGASIGANATILCGIEIGEYAFVGAGAVVTKDVPSFAVVAGNPSKQIGWMSEHGSNLNFENDEATCDESGSIYILKEGVVTKKLND